MQNELRAAVNAAEDRKEYSLAAAFLDRLLREAPTLASAHFVLDRISKTADSKALTPMRVAVLRSFTIEPMLPMLRAAAVLRGLDLEVWVGGFNTYAQELLDPGSSLYAFEPDVVILAVQTRDVLPELWDCFIEAKAPSAAAPVEAFVGAFRSWIEAFRSRSRAHLVVHNLELPDIPAAGILDAQSTMGQSHAVHEMNRRLVEVAKELQGVHVLDYDGLVARHGRRRWHDERKWLTSRMPIAADCLMPLAHEYLRFLAPLGGRIAKALVVDLDNTLWGGVVGEDGVDSLQVGPEYPGAAYLGLQRAILALRARGVLLAISSKNDEVDALNALDRHPGMLLHSHHFAAIRINWDDKPASLRKIAEELNIGVDNLAFLDDNPAERDRVRMELPEAIVVELPSDPMGYAAALKDCPAFERLALSDEDVTRGRLYEEQSQRAEFKRSVASVDDFLRSLQMEMDIAEMVPESVTRIAQLTQKTNQFNLTTRRRSEQDIQALVADSSVRIYQVRLRDRFGDNGLVGVAIMRKGETSSEIDTLLLSCRVIGRTVETAMLARLAADAKASGARFLRGWFLPTRKNGPSSAFYPSHGFSIAESRDGTTLWELDLNAVGPRSPEWIKCHSY